MAAIRYFLDDTARELTRGSEGASGYDLQYAGIERTLIPRQWEALATALFVDMPAGIEGQVRPRSGLAFHHGITVLNAPGTIDSDFRGMIKVILINHSDKDYTVKDGDRIAQLVFAHVLAIPQDERWVEAIEGAPIRVSSLEELRKTTRGEGGFGSTGT